MSPEPDTSRTLRAFWLSFPDDSHLPIGIGVTAYSEADALDLLKTEGIDAWFAGARTVHIAADVRSQDLDVRHVLPNAGPLQFRGVWYPCMNIGFGAPESPGAPGPLRRQNRSEQ